MGRAGRKREGLVAPVAAVVAATQETVASETVAPADTRPRPKDDGEVVGLLGHLLVAPETVLQAVPPQGTPAKVVRPDPVPEKRLGPTTPPSGRLGLVVVHVVGRVVLALGRPQAVEIPTLGPVGVEVGRQGRVDGLETVLVVGQARLGAHIGHVAVVVGRTPVA